MPENSALCKEHLAVLRDIEALRREFNIAIQNQQKQIEIAKAELDRRLEGMNEFRAQLDQQTREFMSRGEIGLVVEGIRRDITYNLTGIGKIEAQLAERGGAKKWSDHIITVLIGVAVIFLIWFMKSL